MDQLTIYKQDGTRQCEDIAPRPLAEDEKVISGLKIPIIGGGRHERLPIMVPAMCGLPTAWANVFDIDATGLSRQQLFQLSANGFNVWRFDASEREAAIAAGGDNPFPLENLSIVATLLGGAQGNPELIRDLVGYVIRVYKTGDMITMDFRRDRVNFETDPQSRRIVRHWFG
jgi:hypothetical protein